MDSGPSHLEKIANRISIPIAVTGHRASVTWPWKDIGNVPSKKFLRSLVSFASRYFDGLCKDSLKLVYVLRQYFTVVSFSFGWIFPVLSH